MSTIKKKKKTTANCSIWHYCGDTTAVAFKRKRRPAPLMPPSANDDEDSAAAANATTESHSIKQKKSYSNNNNHSKSKKISLGPFISFFMFICLEVIIFLSTLDSVVGAKIFYMHWNTSNSIFRIDNTDHIIDVNKGNLAFEYDQVHIICPVYEPGTFDNETEKLIIYNVSKAEYETCRITNANPRIIAVCDKPQKLMYFTITFRPFTPQPGGLEFLPGHDYYFISTSSKDDLHRRIGGRCSTNNMKVVFKVCCSDDKILNDNTMLKSTLPGNDFQITDNNSGGGGGGGGKKTAFAKDHLPGNYSATSTTLSMNYVSHTTNHPISSSRPIINQPVLLSDHDDIYSDIPKNSFNNQQPPSVNAGQQFVGKKSSKNDKNANTAINNESINTNPGENAAKVEVMTTSKGPILQLGCQCLIFCINLCLIFRNELF